MKKILLSLTSLSLTMGLMAQNAQDYKQHLGAAKTIKLSKSQYNGSEKISANGVVSSGMAKAATTAIGYSNYDLQTNSSVCRRLVNLGNGDFTASWTFGDDPNNGTTWANRGTGYNNRNNNAWNAQPQSRIEISERTGWCNLDVLDNNEEYVINHSTTSVGLFMLERTVAGSGTWKEKLLDNDLLPMELWPRYVADGNTMHVIGLTAPSSFGGTPYNGMDGAVLYSRSFDGGDTWDTPIQLPGMTTLEYELLAADDYAIDAKDSTVAITVAGFGNGLYVWISRDAGTTWTHQVVEDNGVVRYDDNTVVNDTVLTFPGDLSVLIDNNDVVHIAASCILFTDDTPGDGQFSFFPGALVNGQMLYWNEERGENNGYLLGGFIETDGDLFNSTDPSNSALFARYGLTEVNYSEQPMLSVGPNNELFITYAGITEETELGGSGFFIRHVFGMKSTDDGESWSYPRDLTAGPTLQFQECVYGTPSREASADSVFFLYQSDDLAGTSFSSGATNPVFQGDAFINFASVSCQTDFSDTIAYVAPYLTGEVEFCLGDSTVLTAAGGGANATYLWSNGATTQAITVTAFGTYTVTVTTNASEFLGTQGAPGTYTPPNPSVQQTFDLEVTVAAPGAAPTASATASQPEACPTDTVMLTAGAVTGGTYIWSTGDTAITTNAVGPGTYTLTVTNCGGSSTTQVVIPALAAPVASVSGSTTACVGDSTLLTAGALLNATYAWSNGTTGPTTYAQVGDTVWMFVTNCTGVDSTQVIIGQVAAPSFTATVTPGNTTCEGTNIGIFTSTGQSGLTFTWFNANGQVATGPSLTLSQPSESGSYYVVGENVCGDTLTIDSIEITINPKPQAPGVTWTVDGSGNLEFTADPGSSSATSYSWLVQGVPQGSTTNTLSNVNWSTLNGKLVTVSFTDANGCTSDDSTVVPVPTSVNEVPVLDEVISVYPNPTNGLLFIEMNGDAGIYNFELRNVVGQMITTRNVSMQNTDVMVMDMSNVEKGIYFVKVSNGAEEIVRRVLVD